MRILICSNAYPPHFVGGAELMAHEQAKALVRLGHEVRAFAGSLGLPRPRHARMDEEHEGIPVYRIATEPEDYSPEYLNFLHPVVEDHFRDVLQDFQPDIVHCHNLIGLSVKLPILARQHGAKTVCTLHDFWGFCLRNTAVRADGTPCDNAAQCRSCLPRIHDGRGLYISMRFRKDFMRLALEHVDHFIAPSHFVADRYIWAGMPADRLTVLPNGIDVERFHPSTLSSAPEDGIRITYVGHFGAHKGVATLLDALPLLNTLPAAVIQLVGEGPEEGAYRARIAELKLTGQVRFPGKVQPADMPDVYARSDIVVLPSVWDENQPVCLMEAMASGLPVVASRRGGIPELIEHGSNGLMFAAGDPRDLALQLARLITAPALRRAAGLNGRKRVEDFSHDRQAHRLVDLYTGLPVPSPILSSAAIYATKGNLRRKMVREDKSLTDGRYPERYFMPREWIADCSAAFRGIVLTGRAWSALRLLGIDAVVTLPQPLRNIGKAKRATSAPDRKDLP